MWFGKALQLSIPLQYLWRAWNPIIIVSSSWTLKAFWFLRALFETYIPLSVYQLVILEGRQSSEDKTMTGRVKVGSWGTEVGRTGKINFACFPILLKAGPGLSLYHVRQGSPIPGSRTSTGPWPVRNRLHSRRWAVGKWVKLHLYLQLLPIACITAWALSPVRSAAALESHRSANPTVNCACEGSRLCAPRESLMPDDLRWSWGGEA